MTAPRYLVLQIDMEKHPRYTDSAHHTGDGVLFPVSCDGYYDSQDAAQGIADYLAERHPGLRTHVVLVVSQ